MPHTDPEILALWAMGEQAGAAGDDQHAEMCLQCRAELARLTELVDLARAGEPEQLQAPPPQVWDRIAAAVGHGMVHPDSVPSLTSAAAQPATVQPDAGHNGASQDAPDQGAVQGTRTRHSRQRRPLVVALAGLAAGLIIGIGGTAGVTELTKAPATRVVAQIQLNPLAQFPQWQGASGTAVMRATSGQQQIAVTLDAPKRPGFYEVWLLARNGVSMISLGELNTDHTGTFTIPAGTDLRDYSRIDVSLQPFNGSTVHVKTSVVRGSLPAAALAAS